jgi:hypothetical protein
LVRRLADTLGLDRQNLLILAHPEAKEIIGEAKPEKVWKTSPSWQRFIENRELLSRYNVTPIRSSVAITGAASKIFAR